MEKSNLAILTMRIWTNLTQLFASLWKEAVAVPVFKRGDRAHLNNYHPMALLSSVGKVCERVVYNKLYKFVSPFLTDQQSGFRRKDGTNLQLIRLVQQWSKALDDSKYVGTVFFDLRKAFDRVWHKGLLVKLEAAGVQGPALSWFASYLSNRQQRTRVTNVVSSPSGLSSGVPQGAILSPLLFIIYVNDIVHATGASVNLFADDTSAFLIDSSPSSLAVRLQESVDSLSQWFDRWLLSVNIQKTAVMALRSIRQQQIQLSVSYKGEQIPQVRVHKHLGLTFNDSLTWEDHVNTISAKASQRIGLLRRYSKRLPPLSIQHFYCSAIRPALEYASVAWCGLSSTASYSLERLQRRAARLISGLPVRSDTPHDIILARAGLQPLSSRRLVEQVVFAFRFLNETLPDHLLDNLQHWNSSKPARATSLRNARKIRLPRAKKAVMKRSPFYLSMSALNDCSDEVLSAVSPKSLRHFLLTRL